MEGVFCFVFSHAIQCHSLNFFLAICGKSLWSLHQKKILFNDLAFDNLSKFFYFLLLLLLIFLDKSIWLIKGCSDISVSICLTLVHQRIFIPRATCHKKILYAWKICPYFIKWERGDYIEDKENKKYQGHVFR